MNNSERWHHQPALYMGAFSAMAERGEHIVVPAVPAARDPESEALATAVTVLAVGALAAVVLVARMNQEVHENI